MATLRQKKAAKEVVENGGIVSRAMVKAGYSPKTAKNPDKLTKSKGWAELLEKYLPDKKLAKVHEEGLGATFEKAMITGRDQDGNPEYEYISKPDFNARHKYLETAYKIKGKTLEPQKDPTVFMPLQINFIVDDSPVKRNQNIVQAEGSHNDTERQGNN